MRLTPALLVTCLVAAPAFAQNTPPAPTTTPAPDAAAKPAPTLSATRGEAPAAEPAGDKPEPTPEEVAAASQPAPPKA